MKKVFSGVVAIEGIDFELRQGEVHALMGENGAGKSTLSKIIAGIYQSDGGELKVNGKVENFASVREAVDHGVSIVTQEFSLLPDLSIAENIFLADKKYYKGGFLADKKAMAAQTYSLLALFGMEKTIDPYAKVSRLSVAQMQVIEILKAVSTQARVIILMSRPRLCRSRRLRFSSASSASSRLRVWDLSLFPTRSMRSMRSLTASRSCGTDG